MPTRKVRITSGPAGRNSVLEIDGEKVTNAHAFTLSADCDGLTTLTVQYANVDVEVEALVETTAFESKSRQYKRVMVRPFSPTDQEWSSLN